MLRFVRQNAIAFLALFVALGGTGAYAFDHVRSVDIVDGQVKARDLARNAVASGKIRDGAVTGPKIADGAVGSAKISAGGVGGSDLANGAVGSAKLADGAVAGAKLADAAVSGAKIADGSVSGADIDESTLGPVPDAALLGGRPASSYLGLSRSRSVATDDCVTSAGAWFGCAPISIEVPAGRTYSITVMAVVNALSPVNQVIAFCAANAGPTCLDPSGIADFLTVPASYAMGVSTNTSTVTGPATFVAQTAVRVQVALVAVPQAKATTTVHVYDIGAELAAAP